MANWVSCKLTIRGNVKDLETFKGLAVGPSSCLDLEQFIPMPKHLKESDDESCFVREPGHGDIKTGQPIRQRKGALFPAWYSWSCRNWGPKWNISDAKILDDQCSDGTLVYEFSTANSPPDNALDEIARQFDSLEFELSCDEEQMNYWAFMFWKDIYYVQEWLSCSAFKKDEIAEECGLPTREAFDAKYGALQQRFHEKVRLLKAVLEALESPKHRTTLKDLISTLEGSAESKEYVHQILRRRRHSEEVIPVAEYESQSAKMDLDQGQAKQDANE